MCFGMICKLKERGTAFLRRLAIQFSKTELRPSIRESALEPSLDRRGVAKTTVLRQGGRLTTSPPRTRQEESSRPTSRTTSRHEGVDIYINPLHPSSPPGDYVSVTIPTEGCCFYSPHGHPVKQAPGFSATSCVFPPGASIGRARLLPAERHGVKHLVAGSSRSRTPPPWRQVRHDPARLRMSPRPGRPDRQAPP